MPGVLLWVLENVGWYVLKSWLTRNKTTEAITKQNKDTGLSDESAIDELHSKWERK